MSERIERADVCVIGTGAGGAPVARALAEAGQRVIVLEEGEETPLSAMTGSPRDMTGRLYRDAGQTMTMGRPPIILPLGRGVGGTTTVNSGTCFRVPEAVQQEWADRLGLEGLGPGSLDGEFAQVEHELAVARVPRELAGRNALVAERGAAALGWSGHFLDRNARGCVGSGVCAFGCPSGAKQHTGQTYMTWAREAGATLHTQTRARRVTIRGGRARAVEAVTRGGDPLTVHADRIVVACGTLHTPGLLARSGITSPQLGRNLSIHPCTAVWAMLDEEVDMGHGVPQSYCIDEFADEGIMLEGISGPPDYLAMAVPFAGPRHREVMLRYRHVAEFGLMLHDTSRGRVLMSRLGRRAGRPIVRYDVNDRDTRTIHAGVRRLVEMFWAAGARTIFTPIAGARELRDGDSSPIERLDADPRRLKLMAFHPLGTARAAARPQDGVVDENFKVHGTDGLYVADGSAVPTALGVNPQMTIMAFATRLAAHLT